MADFLVRILSDSALIPEMKPCPFCGCKPYPFIATYPEMPQYWRNGYWHFENNHKDNCVLKIFDMFSSFHYGEANGTEPTKILLDSIEKWNRRVADG